jgi:hypothetical protein
VFMATDLPGILIVDDNEDNRYTLQLMLESDGHERITCAAGGNEAIALIKKEKFSLVLLDLIMPDLNGDEAEDWYQSLPDRDHRQSIRRRARCLDSRSRRPGASPAGTPRLATDHTRLDGEPSGRKPTRTLACCARAASGHRQSELFGSPLARHELQVLLRMPPRRHCTNHALFDFTYFMSGQRGAF